MLYSGLHFLVASPLLEESVPGKQRSLTDTFCLLQAPVYNWSAETQGIVLSSFFYGYGLTQALGGYCSGLFGGKPVLGSGLLLSSVLTLLVPRAAELGVNFLVGLQVLLGLAEVSRGSRCCQATQPALVNPGCAPCVPSLHAPCYPLQGVIFPAQYTLWAKWAPPLERSRLMNIADAGETQGFFPTTDSASAGPPLTPFFPRQSLQQPQVQGCGSLAKKC